MSTSLTAMFVLSDIDSVPVDRLAANLSRQMTEQPDDLEIRINLARVYAMAYAQKVGQVPAMEQRGGALYPRIGKDGMPHEQFEVKPPKDEKARVAAQEHLTRAIATASRGSNPSAAGSHPSSFRCVRTSLRSTWLMTKPT
jgi:hypothetical protein